MRRRKLTKVCRRCGVEYHPTHTFQTFCGMACRWADEREKNDARMTKPCPQCGKEFRPRFSNRRYCSQSCGVTAYHAGRRAYRTCVVCQKEFGRSPSAVLRTAARYCSRACYETTRSARPAMLEAICEHCGKKFRRTRAAIARTKHVFCGNECSWAFNSGPNSRNWRGGEAHWRGRTWTPALREEIRERDGRRCRMCGKAEVDNGPRRLDVDHVIPFRWFDGDYETANDRSNLVALCTVCHRRKARAERKFLEGDVLEMDRYRTAVALPWPEAMPIDR